MSMRTNRPRSAAVRASRRTLSPASAGSILSPSAVSLTLTFASRPSSSTAVIARSYSSRIASASSRVVTSSPRTSSVAFFPPSFRRRTTVTASASSGPAM